MIFSLPCDEFQLTPTCAPWQVHDGGESKVTTKSIVVGATITIGGFLVSPRDGVRCCPLLTVIYTLSSDTTLESSPES